KYLLEANIRYDGSSRFVGDKRWAWFPSFSVGYNIAREDFFEKLTDNISLLKLRTSWGQLGNTSSRYDSFWDWYPFYQQQSISSASGGWLINGEKPNTAYIPGIVNSSMTWETVETWDVGLDWAAFNNRLTGSFDWYSRTTKDMIGPAPRLGSVLGTNAPKTNNCDMRTTGWELEIGWRDRIRDFKYGARLNLSDARSKILRYPNETGDIYSYYNGKYLNEIWGYESAGIAKTDAEMTEWLKKNKPNWGSNWGAGDVMFKNLVDRKDANGKIIDEGIVNSGNNTLDDHGDLKRIGNSTPRYRFGLNLDAEWKGFDFSIFFQGVLKRDWHFGSGDPYFWGAVGNVWQSAAFKEHMDYWTPENTGAYYPKPYFGEIRKNQIAQTRYLQDASYIRCKNLQFGYSLPQSVLHPSGLSNCRIYVSCDNLFTLTRLSSIYDPEVFGTYGNEWGGSAKTYPLQRTVSVGVNLSF
ncbi:SusC/RagA family TonB-linked outer membrane protein, partial [Tannerella forsythia]|uniref:SusC/RagA family TonB-linked outer membrane protein n=1 Tax=Tannerella forsythia TaxID=28112 RepID=UPI0028EDFBAE